MTRMRTALHWAQAAVGSITLVALILVVGFGVLAIRGGSERQIQPTQSALAGSIGSPEPARPEAASPAPSATAAPPATNPTAVPSPCLNIVAYLDRFTTSVDGMAATSLAVVTGRVLEVSPARWATPDGSAPVFKYGPNPLRAYRVVTVQVGGVARGAVEPGSVLEVRVPGGTIGCTVLSVAGYPALQPGDEVALFLGASRPFGEAPAADFDAVDAWPVRDGQVTAPDGSKMAESAFLAKARP